MAFSYAKHRASKKSSLAQHPSDEEVVLVWIDVNVAGGRAGVEVLVPRQHEESPVRIEGRLEQLAQELAEQAAAVHTRLVQSCTKRQKRSVKDPYY